MSLLSDPATVWIAIVAAAVGTIFWRVLGIVLAGHIDVEGPVYRWVSAVAYAMVAGLIARVLLLPAGPVEPMETALRAAALGAAITVWFLLGRSVMWGLAVGVAVFGAGIFFMN